MYSDVDGAILVLKLNVAVSARMRAKRRTRGKVNKSDEWDWGLGVVQEATAWWRDINSQKDRPEKSHVNGGNTNGLSSQKEKCKKDRKMNNYLAVKPNFLNPPSSTSRKTICALFQYYWLNSLKDTYAIEMTMKSNQFHGSLRNVNPSIQNPRAVILTRDSNV